ncbi:hypothetical protein B0J13DRAFT_440624 [Dactylonectria estremocensis]|uniref:Mur ligase central domain-containing protein n=1 Tax=Dactylonectria estremocensis TaxID=1079267 RepID=A0A9P9J428_9HYPO|nr:hypothetical protein B0J13DRAFT_440624 [Dactylonectria estremocensis]
MSSSKDIQLAIQRINHALVGKRQPGFRDIRLGLGRISKVVSPKQPWRGILVAGTNGKGSICTYLAGLFKLGGIAYGGFTSPAFPESYHGVTLNGLYVNPRMYEMEKQSVQAKWDRLASSWELRHGEDPETMSPFEIETAVAFRVFDRMNVPYGIVEVGMGGATDATNAMRNKAITIISKIGLDHQEFLGNSLENIAKVKAGIMKKNVPCVVDHTNHPSVIRVLREHARKVGTTLLLTWKAEPFLMTLNNEKWKLENYQIQNLLCAALAFRHLFPHKDIDLDKLLATEPYLPGRMENVQVSPEISGKEERNILVDGAHNMLGIEGLVSHVDKWLRKDTQPVSWVMGMSSSKNKPFDKIIEKVVRPQDNFAFVEFAQGPGDPPPAPANYGTDHAKAIVKNPDQIYTGEPEVGAALQWACDKAGKDGPVVVTGSLYLVRDLFKLEGVRRKRELETRKPGLSPLSQSQVYRYAMIAQERKLTEDEEAQFRQAEADLQLSGYHLKLTTVKNSDGEEIDPLKVSEEVAELQRKAAYHKTQAEGYETSIAVIQKDMEQQESTGGSQSPDNVLSALAGKLEGLQKLADNHREEYLEAVHQVRGRVPLLYKADMGYGEVFERLERKRTKPKRDPFLAYYVPPEPTIEDHELDEAEQEAIAAEEEARAEEAKVDRVLASRKRRKIRAKALEADSNDPLVSELSSFNWCSNKMPGLRTHLIVVCCHGIWLGGRSRGGDEAEWLIADFQRGETDTFVEHIKAGVKCLAEDRDSSVLVFSGGPTRNETQLSEAQSYANIAEENGYWGLLPGGVSPGEILVEERALDSYYNVLFALTLFHARAQAWPTRMTIISHGFKKARLIDGHCAAIGFPLERVSFIGIDPPGMAALAAGGEAGGDKEQAMKGVGMAMGEWRSDPQGRGSGLAGKRARRNPWGVGQSVFGEGVRDRGGLMLKEENGEEVLDEDAVRPW